MPALESVLSESVPWLARAKPYLGGLVPVIDYVNTYRREVAAFFANSTASTQATALNRRGSWRSTTCGFRTRSTPRH